MKPPGPRPRRNAATVLTLLAATLLAGPRRSIAQVPPHGAAPPAAEVTIGTVVFLGDTGGLEVDRITTIFQSHIPALRTCYVTALPATPTLSGELQVDVTFGRNGRTTAVSTAGLAAVPAVGQCVARVVHPLAFPHPVTRESHEVRFLATVEFHRPAAAPVP